LFRKFKSKKRDLVASVHGGNKCSRKSWDKKEKEKGKKLLFQGKKGSKKDGGGGERKGRKE